MVSRPCSSAPWSRVCLWVQQESPHEQQQSLLLSRIITNIEKLNEAVMIMNKNLQVQQIDQCTSGINGRQEVNIQNMNVELVAQMFKNYQSNVLFHLEGNPMI